MIILKCFLFPIILCHILAYYLLYTFHLFSKELPWTKCSASWGASENCTTSVYAFYNRTLIRSYDEYYYSYYIIVGTNERKTQRQAIG